MQNNKGVIFTSKKFFCAKTFLRQYFYYAKTFFPKKLFFLPKLFLRQYFCYAKTFLPKQLFFLPKMHFLRQKTLFFDKTFLRQKRHLFGQNFLRNTIIELQQSEERGRVILVKILNLVKKRNFV